MQTPVTEKYTCNVACTGAHHGQIANGADTNAGNSRFMLPLLAVLSSAALLFVAFAFYWTKFSRAEVFFAECAREMIAHHNWVTPLYHNQPFFDKPILVYWFIIGMFNAFGVNHFIARVPSIIAGLLTVGITALATRRLAEKKNNAAGLAAAMCLGSSFMFFSFAYLCMSDMFLVLFDTVTLILVYAGTVVARRRTLLWLLAATSMGLAFVTKGPIGIVLPVISGAAFLFLTKRLSLVKWYHVGLGAVIAAAIAVPWFYAAFKANGTWALAYFFIRENFQRYAGSTYDTHKPIWFMVTSLMTGFLPWSVFLPPALVSFVRQYKQQPQADDTHRKLFLWLWVAVVTGFFSFSRGKCDYYVLPVYPAAAALTALYLTEQARSLPRLLLTILCGIFLAAGMASPFLLRVISPGGFDAWWVLPTALTVFGAAGLAAAARNQQLASLTSLFCAVCFAGAGFAAQLLPAVSQSQSLDVYTQRLRATAPYTRVGVHESLGHWLDELTFTVERDPIQLTDAASIARFFTEGPGMALIPADDYRKALIASAQMQQMHLRVLDRRLVSSHPLTPGYVLKRKGKLYDTDLLLVAN